MFVETEDFTVKMGVHQGSGLNPYLFALLMNELMYKMKQHLLSSDVYRRWNFSRWEYTGIRRYGENILEWNGLIISRAKTKILELGLKNYAGKDGDEHRKRLGGQF